MIKIVCPVCGKFWFTESLEALLKEGEELWKPWLKFMTQEQKDTLQRYNNLETLQKILDKQGYIQMFCLTCQINATVKIMAGILRENL